MVSGKNKMKSGWLRKLLKVGAFLFLFFIVSYSLAVFFLDPGFFSRDFQNKYSQVRGVNLGVVVAGDPEKPLVQMETGCDGENSYVKLSWNSDPLAESFKIIRGGEVLIIGVKDVIYLDEVVDPGTYQYIITAVGFNGFEVSSDLVEVIVDDCSVEDKEANPTCKIKTVDSINVSGFKGVLKIENQKPIFTGHTNLKKAKIKIEIIGQTGIFAEIKANKNGFWQWQPPLDLAYGSYEIRVKAVDPDDSSRYKSDSLVFRIVHELKDEPDKKVILENLPFEIETEVQNPNNIVYAGEDLYLKTTISKLSDFEPWEGNLIYEIKDSNGRILIEFSDQQKIFGNQEIYKKINLSKLLKTEKYKISVKIRYKDFHIFSEDEFYLREKPIICLSSGQVITWTGIFSGLSWIILLLLILILIFLLLLILEHRLTGNAKKQITEGIFREVGFLGKEVDR